MYSPTVALDGHLSDGVDIRKHNIPSKTRSAPFMTRRDRINAWEESLGDPCQTGNKKCYICEEDKLKRIRDNPKIRHLRNLNLTSVINVNKLEI